jgi:hypothetical protein
MITSLAPQYAVGRWESLWARHHFSMIEEPPHWAIRPWPGPRVAALTDDDDDDDDHADSGNEGI